MSTSVARIVGRLPVHVKRASLRALPNFPTRMRNAIVRAGIGETIGDLEALGDKELMALQNVGAVSLAALLEYLERLAAGAPVAERLALEGIPDPTAAVPKPELRSGPPAVSTFRAALEAAIYVARFNERHRRMHICALRLGLDRSVCTLAEIGDRCGITRERVRQVVGKTLERLATYPLAAAFRAVVSAVLAEREAVTIRELTGLSGWLGGISEAGMRVVLEAFVPAVETYYSECARAWLVTARPRADIERALQGVLVRVDAVRRFDRASAAIESVAVRA
ncbi:MAG: hypothetical protein GIX03_13110, partial [Candidatus Eremiobacteraeota bacterium]|nr:hypothetical protein [Candidatus Eremiobacteraeota bacterium]